MLTACLDGKVRRWDAATGLPVGKPLEHPDPASAAIFGPDGKTILTGSGPEPKPDRSGPGAVHCWDATTGKLLGKPLVHPSLVTAVVLSPDKKTFLTVCPHQAQLWSTQDSKPAGPPLRHPGAGVWTAIFSPDGQTILTGGTDGTARLWKADSTGKDVGRFHHGQRVTVVAFHKDGQLLATASDKSPFALLWNVKTGKRVSPPMFHNGAVQTVAFSPDGLLLATGSVVQALDPRDNSSFHSGGEVRLWQATSGLPLGKPLGHPGPVWSLAFNRKSDLLLTGCEDGTAQMFTCATGQPFGNTLYAGGTVRVVAFSADGHTALTATSGTTARLWDVPPGIPFGRPVFRDQSVWSLSFSPSGQLLAVGCEDGVARLWNPGEGRPSDVTFRHGSQIQALGWSPAGDALLAGGVDGWVRLWEHPSGKLRGEIRPAKQVCAVAYRPDGLAFLTGQEVGGFQLCDTAARPLGTPGEAGKSVVGLAFSPDGRTAFVSTGEAEVRCWDLGVARVVREYRHSGPARVVALSPDGGTLLTGGVHESVAQLWDVATGRAKGPPLRMSYRGGVYGAAFSPDGRMVLLCSGPTGRLWDVSTGKPLGPALFQPTNGRAGAFSPSGRLVAMGGKRGAWLWEVPVPLRGPVGRLRLEVEALTGLELDHGVIRPLSVEAMQQRLRQLAGAIGPPTYQH